MASTSDGRTPRCCRCPRGSRHYALVTDADRVLPLCLPCAMQACRAKETVLRRGQVISPRERWPQLGTWRRPLKPPP